MNETQSKETLAKFKRSTAAHLKRLRATGEPLFLTIHGQTEVVVQDAAAYQRLAEAAAESERREAAAAIREGLADAAAGRTRPAKSALRELAKKYRLKLPGG